MENKKGPVHIHKYKESKILGKYGKMLMVNLGKGIGVFLILYYSFEIFQNR